MTTCGYARVSTDGQTLDVQQAALKAAGAERVFSEKQSEAKTDQVMLDHIIQFESYQKNSLVNWAVKDGIASL